MAANAAVQTLFTGVVAHAARRRIADASSMMAGDIYLAGPQGLRYGDVYSVEDGVNLHFAALEDDAHLTFREAVRTPACPTPIARFQLPAGELWRWHSADGTSGEAAFVPHQDYRVPVVDAAAKRALSAAQRPWNRKLTHIRAESPAHPTAEKGTHHLVTNEVNSSFPAFSVRGGAYLGVGGLQNYHHIATAKSELAFILDIDPAVVQTHQAFLALLGQADSVGEFLSMLGGVPLSAPESRMTPAAIGQEIMGRAPDTDFIERTVSAVRRRRGDAAADAVQTFLHQPRDVFWKEFAAELHHNPHHWLADKAAFQHVQQLQRDGRIVVRNADLTGADTLADISKFMANPRDSPATYPRQFNVVYLTNAEDWISQAGGTGYPRFKQNILALPLSDDGVVLRSGSCFAVQDDSFPRWNSDHGFDYMTCPADLFKQVLESQRQGASYRITNASLSDANRRHLGNEMQRMVGFQELRQ